MKITDVTLTLFRWSDIPATRYGAHTGRFGGESQLGLVTISTDEGLAGHAFLGSAMRGAHLDGESLIHYLKPLVVGQDPLDRERLYQAMWQRNRSTTFRAIGAMDVALWDLAGKIAGMPIHRLLGSYRHSAPAYASSAVLPEPAAYAEEAARFKSEGWTAYKIHPPPIRPRTSRCAEAVRGAVGDGYTVMLDSTWAYDYPAAVRVGRAIEELGFHWYEDPLADDDLYNYVKLKQQLAHPHPGHRVLAGRLHRLRALAPRPRHRFPARRRGGQGRHHRARQGCSPGRGLPHELRDPPRRQLAQQRGQPARHHGHQELRVLRGAAAGGGAEVRAGPGHRGGRQGLVHAPSGPGLDAAIDFALIERQKTAVLR